MRLAKILMIVALVYVGIVATFESLLEIGRASCRERV